MAAESEFRIAVDMTVGLAGADSWRTARSEASLAWTLIQRDKASEGEPLLVAARSKLLASVGAQHPATQEATARLVQYYRTRHRDSEADRFSRPPTSGKLAELPNPPGGPPRRIPRECSY